MNWIAVAFGGALGACARYSLALGFASYGFHFPIATFIANGVGCFLMGIGFVYIVDKALLPEVWRCFLMVGMMGALTTFSTFSLEVLSLVQGQDWKMAAVYLVSTLVVSLVAVGSGIALAKVFF